MYEPRFVGCLELMRSLSCMVRDRFKACGKVGLTDAPQTSALSCRLHSAPGPPPPGTHSTLIHKVLHHRAREQQGDSASNEKPPHPAYALHKPLTGRSNPQHPAIAFALALRGGHRERRSV